jgi:hypothetical protein
MLSFSKWTTIDEVVEVPPGFPTMTYSLTPIEQVRNRLDKKEYFTGKALNLSDLLCQYEPVANLCIVNVQIRCHWSGCCSLKCYDSTYKGGQSDRLKRVVTIHSQRSVVCACCDSAKLHIETDFFYIFHHLSKLKCIFEITAMIQLMLCCGVSVPVRFQLTSCTKMDKHLHRLSCLSALSSEAF